MEVTMADTQLTLTAQEREHLVDLLEAALRETKIEEHRTRTPSFREVVVQKENAIASVLKKLGKG
jgi:hypothetical protein